MAYAGEMISSGKGCAIAFVDEKLRSGVISKLFMVGLLLLYYYGGEFFVCFVDNIYNYLLLSAATFSRSVSGSKNNSKL